MVNSSGLPGFKVSDVAAGAGEDVVQALHVTACFQPTLTKGRFSNPAPPNHEHTTLKARATLLWGRKTSGDAGGPERQAEPHSPAVPGLAPMLFTLRFGWRR